MNHNGAKNILLIATEGLSEFPRRIYAQPGDYDFESFGWECDGVPFRIVIRLNSYGFRIFMRGEFNWFDVTDLLNLETLERAAKHLGNA